MGEERIREALAAHVDGPGAPGRAGQGVQAGSELTDDEHAEMVLLTRLADQLTKGMRPRRPSPVFVQSLRAELVEEAGRRMKLRERRQRVARIGAAAAGAAVSIASVVGGAVVLARWLRTRAQARPASTA